MIPSKTKTCASYCRQMCYAKQDRKSRGLHNRLAAKQKARDEVTSNDCTLRRTRHLHGLGLGTGSLFAVSCSQCGRICNCRIRCMTQLTQSKARTHQRVPLLPMPALRTRLWCAQTASCCRCPQSAQAPRARAIAAVAVAVAEAEAAAAMQL